MTKVNPPPQLRIPKELQKNPEVTNFFLQMNTILRQLWVRSGGNEDLFEVLQRLIDSAIQLLHYSLDRPLPEQSDADVLESLFLSTPDVEQVKPVTAPTMQEEGGNNVSLSIQLPAEEDLEVITTSSSIESAGNQVIICENTAVINVRLNPFPDEGETVIIKRRGTNVYAIADTAIVDGDYSASLLLPYDSQTLVYANGEWSIV
ncbi:hypothetical protein LJ739_06740 [Aestuariibacter halophilus]|uniref:Baseplate assembly protein n=1 Tax=Fluctibacter halophilus TaxID=226011 RepID=A0ABS8G6A4_9ALTE|nr:hypothetical protein [Aestuariibacter halophilus]MCC2615933.1 hypothetical protein [Aestuariibacter halophilus]